MTTEEFSNEFDTLIQPYLKSQNYGNIDSISFDEYEKSIFLTKAQESIILDLYSGKNMYNDTFESSEEIRRYLNSLIKTYVCTEENIENYKIVSNSRLYRLPPDLWFITYESVDIDDKSAGCKNGKTILVIPVSQDEFFRINRNPFRGANDRKALRLDNYIDDSSFSEIVSKYDIVNYKIRYISRPNPIIIEDLPDGLKINNIYKKTECQLHPALHRKILDLAVRMALQSKNLNIK